MEFDARNMCSPINKSYVPIGGGRRKGSKKARHARRRNVSITTNSSPGCSPSWPDEDDEEEEAMAVLALSALGRR